jgi:hypothetical protein
MLAPAGGTGKTYFGNLEKDRHENFTERWNSGRG